MPLRYITPITHYALRLTDTGGGAFTYVYNIIVTAIKHTSCTHVAEGH